MGRGRTGKSPGFSAAISAVQVFCSRPIGLLYFLSWFVLCCELCSRSLSVILYNDEAHPTAEFYWRMLSLEVDMNDEPPTETFGSDISTGQFTRIAGQRQNALKAAIGNL